jgi:hypothetical protein
LIQVEKQGVAIVPEVLTRSDIERLDECLIRNLWSEVARECGTCLDIPMS